MPNPKTVLYIDTALTGRPHYREPDEAAIQPHLARIALLLVSDHDEEIVCYSRIIVPKTSWTYEPDAVAAHGISRPLAADLGVTLEDAMTRFLDLRDKAEVLCAYNWDHHRRCLRRASFDLEMDDLELPRSGDPEAFCAMRRATPIVRVPRRQPGGGWAWPRMPVAYSYFTGGAPPAAAADPVQEGARLVRAVREIHDGILAAEAEYRVA